MEMHSCDVLVLGAGLAGLRAAWAAKELSPDLRVIVVAAGAGPSGSSFTNANDRLGMQICFDDAEAEAFSREATELALPGFADPGLVRILVEESQPRFSDLLDLGISFKKNADGLWTKYSACFSPDSSRSVLMEGLAPAHSLIWGKLADIGVERLSGVLARDMLRNPTDGRVLGAVLHNVTSRELTAVSAGAVIIALGGGAPLFALNLSGTGNPGYSLSLLRQAGALLVNTAYLQFFWSRLPSKTFQKLGPLLAPGARLHAAGGGVEAFPEGLAGLLQARDSHCPMGYGLPDSAVDAFLIQHMENGELAMETGDGVIRVALLAHASNGGAKIDEHGRTSAPGLWACGECASGMHGANRLGGAMVTATQVFGKRCGVCAANECIPPAPLQVREAIDSLDVELDVKPLAGHKDWLALSLQKLYLGGEKDRQRLRRDIRHRLDIADDWLSRRLLETALCFLEDSSEKFVKAQTGGDHTADAEGL